MFVKSLEDGFLVRLVKGEELMTVLNTFAKAHEVSGGFFHGLGGAESATLGIYRLDMGKEYHWHDFGGPLEITSLNGNFARDESGEVMVHCHATISGPDMNVSGGHVKEMVILGTCEIFIDLRTGGLTRRMDDEIGLKLLDLS